MDPKQPKGPRRVAACVVTGFLGSGKTTLLRGLLAGDPAGGRVAVVVNEIGEVGIDGRVLGGFEYVENVVELASGCICCSIEEYRFDLAVDELVRRLDPVLLVVETTGVADPGPVLERLRRCGLGLDSVVCVVDALAWRRAWRLTAVARRQIEAADFLVISKGELAGAAAVARLHRSLARVSPRAVVLEGTPDGRFPGADLLLATTASRRSRRAAEVAPDRSKAADVDMAIGHLARDEIESFAWTTSGRVDPARLEAALRGMPAEVIRAKGLARETPGAPVRLFQAVCGRVEASILEGRSGFAVGAQVVVVGPRVGRLRGRLVRCLEACVVADDPPPRAGASQEGSRPG